MGMSGPARAEGDHRDSAGRKLLSDRTAKRRNMDFASGELFDMALMESVLNPFGRASLSFRIYSAR